MHRFIVVINDLCRRNMGIFKVDVASTVDTAVENGRGDKVHVAMGPWTVNC